MLRMFQGTVKGLDGARVIVEVEDGYGLFEARAYIVAAGGASKTKVWAPPAEGDRVLCVLDDEDPASVFLLGCIWTDDAVPAILDEDGIYLEAGKMVTLGKSDGIYLEAGKMVTLGKSDGAKPIPRDDHLQSELESIKSAIDEIHSAMNSHTHQASPAPTGAAAPPVVFTSGYSVGDTACERVEGY